MKDLHLPLDNGLIPLVEIAKLIYPDLDGEDGIDFNKPEFYDNKLLIREIGDKDGSR